MKKLVYLQLLISDLSKTVMYELWYDCVKPKYGKNAKICYMNTDSFIVHVKADHIYKDFNSLIIISTIKYLISAERFKYLLFDKFFVFVKKAGFGLVVADGCYICVILFLLLLRYVN